MNNEYFIIVITILIFIEFHRIITDFIDFFKYKKREILYKSFENLMLIYENVKISAYNDLFISDMSIQLNNNVKLTQDELNKYRDKFIKTFFQLIGPSIIIDLEIFKGNLDSIIKDLSLFFEQKYIEDQAQYMKSDDDFGNDLSSTEII